MNTPADNQAHLPVQPATYDELANLIDSSDEWVVGCLIRLYNLQTPNERNSVRGMTSYNGKGFNIYDSETLNNISQFYNDHGYLTPRQISFVRTSIKKYIRQLLSIGRITPLPLSIPPCKIREANKTAKGIMKEDRTLAAIKVNFSFPHGDNRFGETVKLVKTLPDRKWVADRKYWKVALSIEAGTKLKEWGFEFDDVLQKWIDDLTRPVDFDGVDFSKLDPRLFPYQKEGVAFIESRNGRALIADEQGLGKTCQALSWLQLHPEIRPALIVTPACVKLNWQKEVGFWIKDNNSTHIISGKKPHELPKADIYIINYDILGDAKYDKSTKLYDPKGWTSTLSIMDFQVIIGDEIQRIKNINTKRSRACLYLSSKILAKMGLSGTPIKNKAVEFFNPIKFVNPQIFPSFWKYTDEFTIKEHNGFGWQYKGAKNTEKLHKILTSTIMIRRLAIDVLKDLPPLTRSIVPLEITNKKAYDKVIEELLIWYKGSWEDKQGNLRPNTENPASKMVEISKLRKATIEGKINSVIEWIENFLESDKKLIIFAAHKNTLDILQKKFGDICTRLDGSTSTQGRQDAVDSFQNDPNIKLFLGNIIAAGEGITITAASDVAMVELTFVPADHLQAEKRPHRIGQKNHVNIWYLIAAGTIEEKLAEILNEKMIILKQILDGHSTEKINKDDVLIDLLNDIE